MTNLVRSCFNPWTLVASAALLFGLTPGSLADSYYTNNASATYNVATYWNPNGVPTAATNAMSDNGANLCLILASDPTWSTFDLRAGNGAGATGGFWQQGSIVNCTSWFRMGVGSATSAGTYSISGGTLNVNASGAYMRIGELGAGTLNITNGTVTHTVAPNPIILGQRDTTSYGGASSTGTVNQWGGLLTNNGELWVGNSTAGYPSLAGTYNLNAGIVSQSNWLAVGRSGAVGILNLKGGSFTKYGSGNNVTLGTGSGGSATINMTGGYFTNTQSGTWLGEGGTCTWNLSGTGTNILGTAYVGYDVNGGQGNGLLNISAGAFNTTTLMVGYGNNTAANTVQGYVVQTGGSVSASSGDDRIGGGSGANDVGTVGIYNISGGTLSINANFQIGAYGNGELNLRGGIVSNTAGFGVVGRNAGAFGVLDVSGGSFTFTPTGNKLIVGEQGVGTLNMRGGLVTNLATATAGATLIGGTENTVGTVGVVNLNGGTLNTASVGTGTSSSANVSSTLNFNGGTLQARAASATFLTGLNNAFVWSGGAVIDSQANAITVAQPLIVPTGNGVTSIPVATGGAGYVIPPIVKITGGGGTNATAIAVTNGAGTVASILITSPGVNYTTAPTVTLLGGDFTTAATIGTVTIGANASTGGLTKNGSGTLTLTGGNTFPGNLTLNGGFVNFTNTSNLGTGSTITFNGGGLQYGVSNTIDMSTRTLTFTGTASIDTGANTVTFANPIGNGGAGGLTKVGVGTLNLNAANTFAGGVNVSIGSLVINNNSALGTGAKTITINNGTAGLDQLHLNGSGGAIVLPATMVFQTSNVNAPGCLVNDAGNNVINGAITMTSGGGSTLVTVTSGTLQLAGNITPNTTARTLNLDGPGSGTVSGQILDGGFSPGLIKNGAGTWTLTAANTYSNTTVINAGTLVLGAGGSVSNSSSITVATNAVFDVSAVSGGLVLNGAVHQALVGAGTVNGSIIAASNTVLNPGGTGIAGTLTVSGNLTLNDAVTNLFDISNVTTEGSGVNDEIVVNGALNLSGTNTFLLTPTAGSLASGRYKMIKYSGALSGGATNFTVAFSTIPPRVTLLVDDTIPNEIDLVITATPASLVWQGDGLLNNWDASLTANWTNAAGPSVFVTGDNVTLDDTATNRTVNLVGALVPGSVTVNGTGNYTLSGTGKLTAGTGLTMNDSGVLTILTTNTYTGVTFINNGTVVAGNSNALGSALGGTVITNSATLDVNNQNLGAEPIIVSGSGVGGNGAIISSTGGSTGQQNALSSVTLTGNTTLGANGGRFDVRPNPTANFTANGYALTKTGTNSIFIVSAGDTGLGNITVNSGMLGFQDTTTIGDPTKSLAINPGAGVTFWALASTNIPSKVTTMNSGKLYNASGNNTFAGPITLTGANTVDVVSNAVFTLSAAISDGGNGILIKTNLGTLVLAGTNTYAGGTTVTAGTLAVGNGGTETSLGAGAVTNDGALQFNRSDDYVLANNITDPGVAGTFLKLNTNKLTLQGVNTYLGTGQGIAQVNGGTLQIDPTGALTSGGEFWVAQNATTGACIINGGTLIVSNWIAVGRNNTNALGSLTLNTGSIQKYGAGNIVLGSLGGNGTLTVNSGTIYDNAGLNLGETVGQGQGFFNLNGGLVQALSVGNLGGLSAVARFNGGTLQSISNNATFMTGLSQALVQSGGAVIDDGGYTIGVNQALLNDGTSPGGGLTKKGVGTMVLSGSSTYTGGTLVSNGMLQLNQDAVVHLTFDQSSGNIVTNIGTGGTSMNGYLVGNGVSIVNGGRYGKALSINGAGAGAFTNLVVISNNVVGNINGAGGNWTVGVWVNTSTAGAEYLFNGTTSYTWSSGETIFYLNSASSTAGTNAGMVRFGGGFERGTAGLNNGAWHFVVVSDTGGTITQYVDGTADAWIVNGITAAATGGMWAIGGSPDTGDGTAHFNGLIDEVYMFNRGLSSAEVQALYNNNNNLNPVLPTNTPVMLAVATSTLNLNDVSQTIGSLNGVAGSSVLIGQNDVLTIGNDNTSTTFPGVISGAGGVTKIGSGNLTLTGANTYSANTFVRSGTVVVDTGGSITNLTYDDIGQTSGDNATLNLQGSGVFSTMSDFNVGDVANSTGTVNISGTATLTANALYVGSANAAGSTAIGTINQTNGTVTTLSPNDGVFVIAGRNSVSALGVGNYNLYGGTLNVANAGNTWVGGYGTGALNVSGGSVTLSGFVSIGRFAGGTGNLNISAGSVSQTNAARFTLVGEAGTGVLTVSSNGQLNVLGTQLALGWGATGVGTVNLNGGTITAPMVVLGAGSGTFNFNGGTFKANAASPVFLSGLTTATVQSGGALIDDGGFAITIGQSLLNGGGGLTKLGLGVLTLTNGNTYSGNTVISNGTLALSGAGSISNSPTIVISGGAALDVSGESSVFTLSPGQTLVGSASTASLVGSVNLGGGALALNYTNGTPTLQANNGTVTLNNNAVTVTVLGTALPAGSYKLIATNTGATVTGSISSSPVLVNGAGYSAGAATTLKIVNGELYLVVNHTPVANANTYTRGGLATWKINVTDLLTNATDVDGDTLTLASVGTSTNGVSLIIGSGFVQYANSNLVDDQFSYTVTDGNGGTNSAVITLTAGSIASVAGQINNFTINGGTASMKFAGIPGYLYQVQVSTNLSSWNTLWMTNAPASGVFEFDDPSAPQPNAYYRLMWNGN